MRNKFLKSVAAGLSLALVVTSVNLPAKTASAAKKYRVVEKAVLSAAKKTITAGKKFTLTLKKQSNDKKIKNIKKKYVTVRVSKKSVATVKITKKSGKVTGFKVTAKKAGKATITVKVKSGTYKGTYKCKVTVKKKPVKKKATKKPTKTKKPTEPTKEPSASTKPTEKPVPKAKIAFSVSDAEGNPLGGATIQVLAEGEEVYKDTLAEEAATGETAPLASGMYTLKFSKAGYESSSTSIMVTGTDTIQIPPIKLTKDVTPPQIQDYSFGDQGKSILFVMSEQVKADAAASVKVTGSKGAVDMSVPTVTEDGMTVRISTISGDPLADGKYTVNSLKGISDLAGNALSFEKMELTKETKCEKIQITSTGFAPAAGQSVSYKIFDNFGGEYASADELDFLAPADRIVKVSVFNKGVDGTLTNPIPILKQSTTNKFNLSTLKKDCQLEVTVELGSLSDTQTLPVGDSAVADSFRGIQLVQEATAGEGKYTVDYGTKENPVRFGKDAAKKAKIKLLMRDQYGNDMEDKKDQVVTLTTDDENIIALLDESGNEQRLVREIGTDDGTLLWNAIAVKGIGTTQLTAYLDNGETIFQTISVMPPALTAITKTADVVCPARGEITLPASHFIFTYDEDEEGGYQTPAGDISVECKSVDGNAAKDDIHATVVTNAEDNTFGGLTIKVDKAAVYTMTLTSTNGNKSVDFTVTSTQDEEATDIRLDKTSLSLKKGGVAKTVKLNLLNKYGDSVTPKTKEELEGILTVTVDANVTFKYLKSDGKEAADSDAVTDIALEYTGDDAANSTLEVSLNGTSKKATVTLKCSTATVGSINIVNGITEKDKLILGDETPQYIELEVKDTDGEKMAVQATTALEAKVTSSSNEIDTIPNGFITVVKADKTDGKITENSNGTINALKVDPSVLEKENKFAITYNVTVTHKITNKTSSSKSIRVCEMRRLAKVTADTSAVTLTVGSKKEIHITSFDQYGDKMLLMATEASGACVDSDYRLDDETKSCIVTLTGRDIGEVLQKSYVVTDLHNNSLSVLVDVFVIKADDLVKASVTNTDLKLRQIDFDGDWKEITLDLMGEDKNGNKVKINADDVYIDAMGLPEYIQYKAGVITVKENSISDTTPNTKNFPLSIKKNSSGPVIGSFTISFAKAKPTVSSITEVDGDTNPLEVAVGEENDISNKEFAVKTSYGDTFKINAKDFDEFSSTSKIKADIAEGKATITVADDVTPGTTRPITGYYKDGSVTFHVTVVGKKEPADPAPDEKHTVTITVTGDTTIAASDITVKDSDGNPVSENVAGSNGTFTVSLANGTYTIEVTKDGNTKKGEVTVTDKDATVAINMSAEMSN